MTQSNDTTQTRKSEQFPCPSCGGNMHFDPETGHLKCPFCDNVIDFDEGDEEIKEYNFFAISEEDVSQDWSEGNLTIKCENCGAQTVVGSETMSQFCTFCGSSHIVQVQEFTGIAPESLLPFSIPKEKAMECFKTWIKKRWFAPRALKKEDRNERLKGTYVPYWTYDADLTYAYTAQAGHYYYVTRTRMVDGEMKTERVRKIRWETVHGNGANFFDDIQVSATSKLTKRYVDRLEPFNLSKLTSYKGEFLSGFQAERYSVNVKQGWEEAKQEINAYLHSEVVRKVHADEVRNVRIQIAYNDVRYKHLLVPVWLSSYLYRDKTYQVMINGDNGKVAGKFPVSFWKVFFVVLASLAAIGLIIWLGMSYAS